MMNVDGQMRPPSGDNLKAAERVVFTEESAQGRYVKVIICGELDVGLLDALHAYVERQRRRTRWSRDSSSPLCQKDPEAWEEFSRDSQERPSAIDPQD
jgi:hypothetical protein